MSHKIYFARAKNARVSLIILHMSTFLRSFLSIRAGVQGDKAIEQECMLLK